MAMRDGHDDILREEAGRRHRGTVRDCIDCGKRIRNRPLSHRPAVRMAVRPESMGHMVVFERRKRCTGRIFASVCIYFHLAGFAGLFGIMVAAVLTRRWRQLAEVTVLTVLLTLPYSIHFLRYHRWYYGGHPTVAFQPAPLVDLLAIAGTVFLIRRGTQRQFVIAWLLAPLAWMFQVPVRFGVQSTLFGSVVGGVFVSAMIARIDSRRWRWATGGIFLVIASILPIGMPSLLYEVSWDLGMRYPKDMDWVEARKLAKVIGDNHLSKRIVCDYDGDTAPALAVYEPVRLQRGHWLEVHPQYDPADDIPASEKVYVVPVAPDDPILRNLVRSRMVDDWGGTSRTAVITLRQNFSHPLAADIIRSAIQSAGSRLAESINNQHPGVQGSSLSVPIERC